MQKKLSEFISASVKDADILVFMITLKNVDKEIKIFEDEKMRGFVSAKNMKKILVINKIDLSNEKICYKSHLAFNEMNIFDKIIPISALKIII